jgi:hypothetical protein
MPFGLLDHPVVLMPTLHVWQALLGFCVPLL